MSRVHRASFLLVPLLLAGAPAPATAQASADSAWERGDRERARELYADRLAADSTDQLALLRLGLLEAWEEDFGRSLRLLDRLLELNPDRADAAVVRSRVLAWSGERRAAKDTLRGVLRHRPEDVSALMTLGRIHLWDGDLTAALDAFARATEARPSEPEPWVARGDVLRRLDELDRAGDAYRRALDADSASGRALAGLAHLELERRRYDVADSLYRALRPGDELEALKGRARVSAWRGDLTRAERLWRMALERAPRDGEAVEGLAQTLRWQGRDAAAMEVMREYRAVRAGAVREQWEWARSHTAPRLSVRASGARDSDENEMVTLSSSGSFRPLPRLEVRASAYRRDHEQETSTFRVARESDGAELGLWLQIEPGWTLEADAGRTRFLGDDAEVTTFGFGLGTPGRQPFSVDASFRRSVADHTAVLIRNQVTVDEASLAGRWRLGADWDLDLTASWAEFEGTRANRRLRGALELEWSLGGPWYLGLRNEAFGFEEDLNDGYFDPAFYGTTELIAGVRERSDPVAVRLSVSPGVRLLDRFGQASETAGTFGADGEIELFLVPGRALEIGATYSKSEPRVFAGEETGYEYYGARVGLSFVF